MGSGRVRDAAAPCLQTPLLSSGYSPQRCSLEQSPLQRQRQIRLTYQAHSVFRRSSSRPKQRRREHLFKECSHLGKHTCWIIVCRSDLPCCRRRRHIHPFRNEADAAGRRRDHFLEGTWTSYPLSFQFARVSWSCCPFREQVKTRQLRERRSRRDRETHPRSFGDECFDDRPADAPCASRDQTGLSFPVRRHLGADGLKERPRFWPSVILLPEMGIR